ncbi:hypothetical protein MTO96_037179 [Rhipicephalus appendiculatus]
MRADAATERGAALALQGQLVDARREIAGLQRQVLVAERPLVGYVLGGLAAVPAAVGPAAPVFPGAPGAEAAMGAAPMGPAVLGGPTYAAMVRAGGPARAPGAGQAGPAGLAISEYRATDSRVWDVKILLRDISAVTEITLYHVPGYSGLFGNELADFLAARAARMGDARQAPLTPRAVRSALRREQLRRWELDWRENNADTDLFKWVPHVLDAPPWFPPNKALVTFLTGHGRFHSILSQI